MSRIELFYALVFVFWVILMASWWIFLLVGKCDYLVFLLVQNVPSRCLVN